MHRTDALFFFKQSSSIRQIMPPPQERQRQRNDLSYRINQFAQGIDGLSALYARFEGIESQAELSLKPDVGKIIGFAALCILDHQEATALQEKGVYLSRSLEALEAAETTISQQEAKQNKSPEYQFLTLSYNREHYGLARCFVALAQTSQEAEDKRQYLEKALYHLEFISHSCLSYAPVHLQQAQLLTQLATSADDPADILSYLESARERIQTARKIGTDEPDSITGIRYAIPAEEDSLHQLEAQINEMWERYTPPSEATTPTSSPDLTQQAAATTNTVDIAAARKEAQRQEAEEEAVLREKLEDSSLSASEMTSARRKLAEMLIKRGSFVQAVQVLEEGHLQTDDANYATLLSQTLLEAADALLNQASENQNPEEARQLRTAARSYVEKVLDRNPYYSGALFLRLRIQHFAPAETAKSNTDNQLIRTQTLRMVFGRVRTLFSGR